MPESSFSIRSLVFDLVDQYARKKPASGQLGLFEDPSEKQRPLFSKKPEDEKGRWITIRGSHVYVSGEDGRILKGPKGFIGKNVAKLNEESGRGGEEETPKPSPKGLAELGKISGGRPENRQQRMFETINPGLFKDEFMKAFKEKTGVAIDEIPSPPPAEEKPKTGDWMTYKGTPFKVAHSFEDKRTGTTVVVPSYETFSSHGRVPSEMAIGEVEKSSEPKSKPEPEQKSEPEFQLQRPPSPPPKKTDFGNNQSTKQSGLFDAGKKGELKGQELLFNSDAGDVGNPKTMENRVQAEDKGPQQGDVDSEGLVFRNGRWHRDEDEKPEEPSSSSADSETFDPEKHGDYRSLAELGRKIDSGELTHEEFQKAHAFYAKHKAEFIADLSKRYDAKKLKNIAANLGDWRAIRGENKKSENAESVYAAMMQRAFDVGKGISNTYSMEDIRGEGGMTGAAIRRLAEHVGKQTPESLAEHVAGNAKAIAERKEAEKANDEAAENPKTLADFELTLKRVGGYEKMTPEQQATYDDLMTEKTRGKRSEAKKPTTVKAEVSDDHGGFAESQSFHSKRGKDIFTASPKNRVERDEYNAMNTAAKQLGGWYYKSYGNTPAGFHFPDAESRAKFLKAMGGESVDRSDILEKKQAEREKTVGEKLADHADRLEERASASYSAERKENTNKRAGQAASARANAEHDMNQATRLRSIAKAMADGETKHLNGMHALTQLESLQRIWRQAQRKHEEQKLQEKYGDEWRNKATHTERENTYQAGVDPSSIAHAKIPRQVIYPANVSKFLEQAANTPGLKQEAAKWKKLFARHTSDEKEKLTLSKSSTKEWFDFSNRAKSKGVKSDWSGFGEKDDFQRLYAMGIQDDHELRSALRELAPHQSNKNSKVKHDPIQELEKKIHREHKAEGFYPTPPRVVDRMMEHADIRDGQSVLEPSAGSGRIMDAIRSSHGDGVHLKGIEHHSSLQDLLKMKGHDVEHDDFLQHKGEYDRIVMNPPFENDAAIDHVKHAFSLLKPGGKLVAVVPGNDRTYREAGRNKRKEFADMVDEHGSFEDLPEGSFAGSDAPRQTGVNTSLVVLQKPGGSSSDKYSRLQIYETMNEVIDRYMRDDQVQTPIQIDHYAHPLIHAAVGAAAHTAVQHLAPRSPGGIIKKLAHAAVASAMAAWIASSSANGGNQQNQSPAAAAAAAVPPRTPAQRLAHGGNIFNQIAANAMAKHAAKQQAAANAPPSPNVQAAQESAANSGAKAGVQLERPSRPLKDPGDKSSAGKGEGSGPGAGGPGATGSGAGGFKGDDHPRESSFHDGKKPGQFAPKGEGSTGSNKSKNGDFTDEFIEQLRANQDRAAGLPVPAFLKKDPRQPYIDGEYLHPDLKKANIANLDSSSFSAEKGEDSESPSPRNYPDNLDKPASEQTNYAPEQRSIEGSYPEGSYDVWHSPKTSESQGYSGAASAGLGDAFATDNHDYAAQYGTPEKHTATIKNPYQMDAAEFRSFDRGHDASFAKSKARREELQAAGHDGIIVTHADGVKEHILFDRNNLKKQGNGSQQQPQPFIKPDNGKTAPAPNPRKAMAEGRSPVPLHPLVFPTKEELKAQKKAEKQAEKQQSERVDFNPDKLEEESSKTSTYRQAKKSILPEIALEHDLDHDLLQHAVNEELKMVLPAHQRQEEARKYISKLGWHAGRINRKEDSYGDHSRTNLDENASEWAGLFPEIAGSDESEWVSKMWDLSKQGVQDPPSATDEDFVRSVAKKLVDQGYAEGSSGANASSFSADEGSGFDDESDLQPVHGSPGDLDYTPFSRAYVDMIVDKYLRKHGVS